MTPTHHRQVQVFKRQAKVTRLENVRLKLLSVTARGTATMRSSIMILAVFFCLGSAQTLIDPLVSGPQVQSLAQ